MTNPEDHPEFYGTCRTCGRAISFHDGMWHHAPGAVTDGHAAVK